MNDSNSSSRAVSSWLWLLLAVASGFFASGKWVIPLAAWVSPIFMLRFLSLQKGWKGYFAFVVVGYVGFVVTQHGLIPIPDHTFYVGAIIAILTGYVPYFLHRQTAINKSNHFALRN